MEEHQRPLGRHTALLELKQSTPKVGSARWTLPWGISESNQEHGNALGIFKISLVPWSAGLPISLALQGLS